MRALRDVFSLRYELFSMDEFHCCLDLLACMPAPCVKPQHVHGVLRAGQQLFVFVCALFAGEGIRGGAGGGAWDVWMGVGGRGGWLALVVSTVFAATIHVLRVLSARVSRGHRASV